MVDMGGECVLGGWVHVLAAHARPAAPTAPHCRRKYGSAAMKAHGFTQKGNTVSFVNSFPPPLLPFKEIYSRLT